MVRQHPNLAPDFSVWENCILGAESKNFIWMNSPACRKRTAALNEQWGFYLPLDKNAGELTVSEVQKAAILALLLRDVRFLIFDEPTAVLNPAETEKLFELFKKLKSEGKGIVLISHKLDETLPLADRLTVLRHGKTAAVLEAPQQSEYLAGLIFGPVNTAAVSNTAPVITEGDLGAVLSLKNFTVNAVGRPLIRGISLCLERGKILGIAGVRDSGLETLELAVAGFLPSSGSITINGNALVKRSARSFRNAGGAYLGTRTEGMNLTLRDILIIHAHRHFQKCGFLAVKQLEAWSRLLIKRAKISMQGSVSAAAPATALSGGQLQRLVLTRELAEESPLLVLSEPGRGLDLRYRKILAVRLREYAAKGKGILLFSSDSEELLALCDTVMVLRDGVFSSSIESCDTDAGKKIREAMVGRV
jgi:simple sugar transport system ATP-binding protein